MILLRWMNSMLSFFAVSRQTNWLVVSCQEKSKEKYTSFVEDIISAAKQIRQEVNNIMKIHTVLFMRTIIFNNRYQQWSVIF